LLISASVDALPNISGKGLELARVAIDVELVEHLVADDHGEAVEVGFLNDGLELAGSRLLLSGGRCPAENRSGAED